MTIRGVLSSRVILAASLLVIGLVLTAGAIDEIDKSSAVATFVAAVELALAIGACSLGARAIASRVEVRRGKVYLHYLWMTRCVGQSDIVRLTRTSWFGWDIVAIQLSDGRVWRLPLLTQPGNPQRLDAQEAALSRELRHGESSR